MSIGPEQLRLLQGYLEHADPMEKNASNLAREAVILHLILLHDYDKSGRLDGLETMQLLRGILTHKMQEPPPPKSVILLVDDILDTQDINRDGFLDAHELLVPAIYGEDALLKVEENSAVHVAIPPPQNVQNENKAESQETVINVEERSVENEAQGVINEALPSPEEPLVEESEELIGQTMAEVLEGEEMENVEEVVVEREM
uniref:EF-hand domain-containing protein n=1 Tax=Leptobrachium leishanense TaxID=445787 RepID=A0A8C5MRC0_9ANUR